VAEVDEALHKYGFVTPLGSFSQLGITGMTLIGGQGFLVRLFGLASDNVLEYGKTCYIKKTIIISAIQLREPGSREVVS